MSAQEALTRWLQHYDVEQVLQPIENLRERLGDMGEDTEAMVADKVADVFRPLFRDDVEDAEVEKAVDALLDLVRAHCNAQTEDVCRLIDQATDDVHRYAEEHAA